MWDRIYIYLVIKLFQVLEDVIHTNEYEWYFIFILFNKYIFNSGPNSNKLPGMCTFYQGKRRQPRARKDHSVTKYFDGSSGKVCDFKNFILKSVCYNKFKVDIIS